MQFTRDSVVLASFVSFVQSSSSGVKKTFFWKARKTEKNGKTNRDMLKLESSAE